MNEPPLLTEKLARRLEGAGVRFSVDWIDSIRRASTALGVELERFGAAVGSACRARPELDFMNRVGGLWPEDEPRVGEIAAFYRERGLRPWFELVPAEGFERLAARLSEIGAAQIGFHAMLYGLPEPPPTRREVRVRELEPEEVGSFADVLLEGHGVRAEHRAEARRGIERWPHVDGWRLYLAEVEGEPVAAAVLSIADGIGYLANASTRPAFRCRGCQTALVGRRIADANAAGCELVCGQAGFASASQRNLQRAGLRLAYTKAVWRVRAAP